MESRSFGANLEAMRERALRSDRCIREAWTKLSKRSMEIGWEGSFLKQHSLWPLLGYASEKDYRAAAGIGRSTWYTMINLAECFERLDKEQFLSMTIENAKHLATLAGDARYNPDLLRKAATMSERDFEHAVVMDTARRENRPVGDVRVTMKWRLSQAQRAVIERGLEDWQNEHNIDDPARAMELLVVEYTNRATLVGFISESIPRLTRAVTSANSADEMVSLRALFATHIQEMGEILRLCCQAKGRAEYAA
jgi:hypothetical protein